jgi:hypothetical protein
MNISSKKTAVTEKRPATKAKPSGEGFPFTRENYKWMIIGSVITIIGFFLMSGGGTDDPTQFAGDTLFSPLRLTIAPIVILGGMGVVLYSIVKRPKPE